MTQQKKKQRTGQKPARTHAVSAQPSKARAAKREAPQLVHAAAFWNPASGRVDWCLYRQPHEDSLPTVSECHEAWVVEGPAGRVHVADEVASIAGIPMEAVAVVEMQDTADVSHG